MQQMKFCNSNRLIGNESSWLLIYRKTRTLVVYDAMRQKVDVGIARLLQQEGFERLGAHNLRLIKVAAMEDEISSWRAEECRQNKLDVILVHSGK